MTIADKRVPLLFLIGDTGGGHRSAAQAVGEALERQYPGKFEPVIADPLTGPGTPPGMRWFVSLYAPLIRLTPWLWHVSWRFSNRKWGLSLMYSTAFAPARTTVTRAIDACRPAAVVAFHGMVTRPAVLARQRVLPAVPVLTVITDLVTAHRAWREPRVDQIAVPSTAVGRSCQADGFPAGRCTDTGLPVSAAFTAPPATEAERLALRAALGADPGRFLVVLTGGAAGAGRLCPKATALIRAFPDVTVVVVCGRNEQLRRRLTLESWRYSDRLLPLGFVTNMADWLRCADAVVTKAGPGTIAETLCCGTPLLLTSYLSGQEKGNAEFVVNARAGRWVPQLPQLLDAVRELRDDPVLLGQMRINAASVGRPDAAAAVARLIADMAAPRLGSFVPAAEAAAHHVPFRARIRKRPVASRLPEPAVR
jgi:UDP-N-acetylglucosamine:LPS N-acetylglucosamine transferase